VGGDDSVTVVGHRRAVLLAIGAVAVVIVVAVVVTASLWFARDAPGARSLDDALADFRAGDPTAIESLGAVVQRPRPGVYEAAGDGRASISFPPTSQSYGATIPVIVRADGAECWTTEVDFNEDSRQTWSHCVRGGEVLENFNRTDTTWDLGVMTIDESLTFTCAPPGVNIRSGARPGDATRYRCTGSSRTVSGSTDSDVSFTLIGAEEIEIGGIAVPAFHYREVDTLTGPQTGSSTIDYWYSIETFLLIGMERTVRIRTDSPVGSITYSETGSWRLRSTEPLR